MSHFFHLISVVALLFIQIGHSNDIDGKPILVHGAFTPVEVWGDVDHRLTQAGYGRVFPIRLPSVGTVTSGRQPDIDAVRSTLAAELASGKDVVLVGHSYGGTVVGEAVKIFRADAAPSIPVRRSLLYRKYARPPPRGKILGLIMLSSYIPYTTEVTVPGSRPDIRSIAPSWFNFANMPKVTPDGDPALPPRTLFFNDFSDIRIAFWSPKFSFSAFGALNATATYIPYTGDFQCTYVVTDLDNTVPPAWAQSFIDQPGAVWSVEHVHASHYSMISKPDDVARVIKKVAGDPCCV
ncbi:Alpha/Beta hydrolase protein [Clohesyomyces aquaticus]|uniref:Alpha/Beta hydrolase protein n=1 Tax=Clohesyomyces aquaticus TaxID=1231657 RepID=A0A1Y1ZIB0_9PLEO|nr:Alpha/Beta hydrolase protein [Clohesyomyces aquaticus]